jgi:ethanolamine utilization protein EutP (predicted NTPase)
VFNIQLSLLIALLEEYGGSMASNSYQEYLEVAGELFRKPAMMIQLAMQEHDRQTDNDTERVLPENQQTLSDALADIVDIPGISVDTEVDLSDQQAQRVQDRVQKRLGGEM